MDFIDNKPIYVQIIDFFCSQILQKKWRADDRIPSVRDIAIQMEVNPNTAIRAFHDLSDKGILYNQRGVGYFVASGAYDKVKQLKRAEFIEQRLPVFFRDMKQLGFTCSELEELYNDTV